MEIINPKDPMEPIPAKSFRLQYTLKEAAYILNTSQNTLLDWLNSNEIPYYKINGKGSNFVLHKDLEVLIKRGAVFANMQFEEFYGDVLKNWESDDKRDGIQQKKS